MTHFIQDGTEFVLAAPSGRIVCSFDNEEQARKQLGKQSSGCKLYKRTVTCQELPANAG